MDNAIEFVDVDAVCGRIEVAFEAKPADRHLAAHDRRAAGWGGCLRSARARTGRMPQILDIEHERLQVVDLVLNRQRHFDAAYGFGLFLRDDTFVGEVSLGSVQRGPFQSGAVGYWIDEALAGSHQALARVISLVEDGDPEGQTLLRQLHPRTGGAYTVGILTVDHQVPFWIAFALAGVVTGVLGFFIGILSLLKYLGVWF